MTTKITVLGLGAMGSRMAANLLKTGHAVTVWNRSPEAAATLVAQGAKQAPTPREAVAEADFVISMVRDDEASRHVWLAPGSGALEGIRKEAIAIESSTLTPAWIGELGAAFSRHGASLIDAPVAGSRMQAEAGQLVYLVGGDEAIVQKAEPVLKDMGSAVHHVGSLGSGALVKLATNAMLGVQLTTIAELIGLLEKSGADTARAIKAIASTAVWSPAANNLSAGMLAGNFAPQFPVGLIEKDFGYAAALAGSPDAAPTINAARKIFQRAIAAGLEDQNMTAVVRLFRDGLR